MKGMRWVIAATLVAASAAHGKLPPLSPEQQAAAEQKKAQEAENAKKEQAALTRVQDRIAAQFGRGASAANSGSVTETQKLPQKAVDAAGKAGPTGGTAQSAEAHSAPAR